MESITQEQINALKNVMAEIDSKLLVKTRCLAILLNALRFVVLRASLRFHALLCAFPTMQTPFVDLDVFCNQQVRVEWEVTGERGTYNMGSVDVGPADGANAIPASVDELLVRSSYRITFLTVQVECLGCSALCIY